jgi:hypothetical protein
MVAVKGKPVNIRRPVACRAGVYILCTYWVLIITTYLTVDIFLDLYTTRDSAALAWYSAAFSIPLAALTLYFMRKDVFGKWYTYIFSPLIAFGLYLGCTYFNALNLDLLLGAALKPTIEETLPVESVNRVFARKAGFIHTDVALLYHNKSIIFQGTRTSYFLLRNTKALNATIGRSYLGNYFATRLQMPAQQRWAARYEYLKDWFYRYLWLLIGFPLLLLLGYLKDRFFPGSATTPKQEAHPYRKFFDRLLIILLCVFGLFMLLLLLLGIFL